MTTRHSSLNSSRVPTADNRGNLMTHAVLFRYLWRRDTRWPEVAGHCRVPYKKRAEHPARASPECSTRVLFKSANTQSGADAVAHAGTVSACAKAVAWRHALVLIRHRTCPSNQRPESIPPSLTHFAGSTPSSLFLRPVLLFHLSIHYN